MKHQEFYAIALEQLAEMVEKNETNLLKTADFCGESIINEGVVHVFGTGHSQMFAMEIFYRAGGLVPINALLTPHYSLAPKAKLSTIQERVEGFSNQYLELEKTSKFDTMIIVSISGRNPAAVDMALEAKKFGMKVVALTSLSFSEGVSSRHSSKKMLKDIADIVLDIPCIKGDAVLSIAGLPEKFCGTSTVLGMMTMEMIIARTVEILVDKGYSPPIYVSSNLDEGDQINAALIKKYQDKISYL